MAGLLKREPRELEQLDLFDRFDRMFDEWTKVLPFRRAYVPEELIRVDEFHEGATLVIRAELPGIDPEKDVEVTVADGMLRISAERREEEKIEEKGYLRHEMRSGSFTRALALPDGVAEADIQATYKDGILEIRVPAPEPTPATKIPVAKS